MKPIPINELKERETYMIVGTTGIYKGMVGGLFEVISIDFPYAVLFWLGSVLPHRLTANLKEFIEAALPEEAWPDVIGEREQTL